MYEQIQSNLKREQEKRKRLHAAMLSSMQGMGDTQMVSGRAVPYGVGEGLSKIAQAMLYKRGINNAEDKEDDLMDKYKTEKQGAIADVMDTYSGREEVLDVADMTDIESESAIASDPEKAAVMAAGNEYTSGISPVITAMMKNKAYSDRNSVDPYFTQFIGEDGKAYSFNNRSGATEPLGLVSGKLDPTTQGNIAGSKQQAKADVDLTMNPQITTADENAKQNVLIEKEPKKKKAIMLAEREAEKIINKPKAEAKLAGSYAKFDMLDKKIDDAKEKSSFWTTGLLGQLGGGIGGTPQHNLAMALQTIKANLGFDKLQDMRDNSPTGGALGQVSEMENKLLQDAWSSVQQSQTEEELDNNLDAIKVLQRESWGRINDAHFKDYGEYLFDPINPDNLPTPQDSAVPAFDDAEKERRYQEWKAKQ